jgi:4,5:9,10-diseco-3-hydroxy-5,9,17-trioxoandrosta-1(10),2-diene-4-oate hydrolase
VEIEAMDAFRMEVGTVPEASPTDRYVEIGHIRTRYWTLGEGEPPVVLLHGLGGYIENWQGNLRALARVRQVYALDLVGSGRSDKPRVEYSIPYLTEFVRRFIASLRIGRATFVGESMGGIIALRLALDVPHQVEKLVLAGSGGLGNGVSIFLRLMSLPVLGELLSRPSRSGTAQFLRLLFENEDLIAEEWIEEDYEMASLPGAQRAMLSTLRSMVTIWGGRGDVHGPLCERLGEIEVPTLIIWGAQDRILPVEQAHRAARDLPDARLHVLDPCGHVPNIERAEAFNALVTDFLSDG